MTEAADIAFAHSRRLVIAGLVVRLADHLLARPVGPHGVLQVIAVPDEDVAGVTAAVAVAREWLAVNATGKVSGPELLRRIGRALQTYPTGGTDQRIQTIHAATSGPRRPLVISATHLNRQARSALAMFGTHRFVFATIITTDSAARSFDRGGRADRNRVRLVTNHQRERFSNALYRLGRWKGRRQQAARMK